MPIGVDNSGGWEALTGELTERAKARDAQQKMLTETLLKGHLAQADDKRREKLEQSKADREIAVLGEKDRLTREKEERGAREHTDLLSKLNVPAEHPLGPWIEAVKGGAQVTPATLPTLQGVMKGDFAQNRADTAAAAAGERARLAAEMKNLANTYQPEDLPRVEGRLERLRAKDPKHPEIAGLEAIRDQLGAGLTPTGKLALERAERDEVQAGFKTVLQAQQDKAAAERQAAALRERTSTQLELMKLRNKLSKELKNSPTAKQTFDAMSTTVTKLGMKLAAAREELRAAQAKASGGKDPRYEQEVAALTDQVAGLAAEFEAATGALDNERVRLFGAQGATKLPGGQMTPEAEQSLFNSIATEKDFRAYFPGGVVTPEVLKKFKQDYPEEAKKFNARVKERIKQRGLK